MKTYGKFTTGLIAVWFTFALSASALGLFANNDNRFGLAVAFAALTPLVVFSLWFAASPKFRQFLFSLNPRLLTFAQTSRIIGIIFVILEARGVLPAIFASPAGYGDIFIGVTAPFVAWKLANSTYRRRFILWQFLGILDLVNAVALGTTAPLLVAHDVSMAAMTELPLSLIPTFAVPLLLIFHVICIAQARGWKSTFENPIIVRRLANGAVGDSF